MLSEKNLNAYRQLGLARFEQLLLDLPDEIQAVDDFVDTSIRQMSNLPARSADEPPYQELCGHLLTPGKCREIATDPLEELLPEIPEIPEMVETDNGIDKYIRKLSDLPEKPENADPYIRLFILRDETKPVEPMATEATDIQSSQEYVTAEQVLQIIGSASLQDRVRAMMPGINATFERFEINTPLRMAHFGQVLHESGGFRWLREIWGPSDSIVARKSFINSLITPLNFQSTFVDK
ncbi:MAG: hypothetical protein ACFBSF_20665 [Leptolyngbyaceae cyanobacterium]